MTNYTKTTDFAAKDALPSGNAAKIVKGSEIDAEFDNIATSSATKANANAAALTGTTTFETISDGTIAITAFVDEDNMASDSATLLPTQQSVKAYVDSQVTAQDLDFQADTGGALSIDLDSETLTLTGGTGIDTSGALNAVTFAIDATVATLAGTQTLSNKTLSAPVVSGNLTTDGLVDGRDVATDGTKLDGIEALADVTDTANVTAAGALMDSELTDIAAVKALDQGVATTDSPTFAGLTTTADVSFGDNDKAIFGAGSDLQIYHDGSHSYIDDVGGTGNLKIRATNLVLQSAIDENYATFVANGAASLFYDNAEKLATTSTGIDVTGTVTADGLTVQTAQGDITIPASTSSLNFGRAGANYIRATDAAGSFTFITGANDFATQRMKLANNGDISFYNSAGTSQSLFWDSSAESLGIGTSSPDEALEVSGDLKISGSNFGIVQFGETSDQTKIVGRDSSHASLPNTMEFFTSSVNRMRIDSSGNLLVGTTQAHLTSSTFSGYTQFAGGQSIQKRSGGIVAYYDRLTNDGEILQFRRQGTIVGSISAASNDLNINGGANHSGIRFQATGLYPLENGSASSGEIDLGAAGSKFKNLYLSGGVYLGGTSSANYLDDYEEGTWTPSLRRNDGTVAATHSTVGATYVKIGRTVIVKAWIYAINATGTDGSSYWRVLGLPFSSTSYGAMRLAYNDTGADSIYSSAAVGILASGVSAYTGSLSGGFMIDFAYETNE